jgi:hypothetical protein
MQFTRWDHRLRISESDALVQQLAIWHGSRIEDANLRARVLNDLKTNYANLLDYSIDYSLLSLGDSRHLRQVLAFFQKRKDIDFGFDREELAWQKFVASETLCRETNELFRGRNSGLLNIQPLVERVLLHAANKIESILGPVPSLSTLRPRFGPGATTQLQRRSASPRAKLGSTPACSIELSRYAEIIMQNEMPEWYFSLVEGLAPGKEFTVDIHPGKLALVPKSAKEFRSVMVEPSLNTMWQAAIGSYMAGRLRGCGIDIRDQSRNQRLARKGSLDGSLATVDLSSASDTIATELVWSLLPSDWFFFLRKFRTGTCVYRSQTLQLQKFSSMGNGFTFPLETLIFYSIAFGVCVESGVPVTDLSAYGDDLIVPSGVVDLLYRALEVCGFVVNSKKSYREGPFRESCGADYYQGTDIRPLYIKDSIHVFDIFRIHNHYYECWDAPDVVSYLASLIHPSIRIYGPAGFGNGHLLGSWCPAFKAKHLARGFGGHIFETFRMRPIRSSREYPNGRILPLYTTYLSEEGVTADPDSSESAAYDRNGRLTTIVPGWRGFDRISVYTFVR